MHDGADTCYKDGVKIQVKVGGKWRDAEAVIDRHNCAWVKLPYPYAPKPFMEWRTPVKSKRERGRK